MNKEEIINLLGIILFYSLIVFGVIGLNARFEQINKKNSTNEPTTQIVQNQNR